MFHPARFAASTAYLMVALALASTSHAQTPPMKPGLWEVTPDSQMVNGQPIPDMSAKLAEQMKHMPPDMRAQMEAQMKARGIQLAPDSKGLNMRMCITKEMLAQNRWQKVEGHCQNAAPKITGATWRWKFTCSEPPSDGEGSTTFQGSEAYTGDMQMHTTRNGQVQTVAMKHHAKWLGADCGALKPQEAAAQ